MIKMISIQKRGKVYQYRFEAAKVNEKRKWISKSGFKQKMLHLSQDKKLMMNIKMEDVKRKAICHMEIIWIIG